MAINHGNGGQDAGSQAATLRDGAGFLERTPSEWPRDVEHLKAIAHFIEAQQREIERLRWCAQQIVTMANEGIWSGQPNTVRRALEALGTKP